MIKRPMIFFAISLCLGILLTSIFKMIPAIVIGIIFLFVGICLLLIVKGYKALIIGTVIFYLLGVIQFSFFENKYNDTFSDYENKTVAVVGNIISDPVVSDGRASYIINTQHISYEGRTESINGKILLKTYLEEDFEPYNYGKKVWVEGIIRLPKGQRNPGGFNYKRYLTVSGISATMYVPFEKIEDKGYFKKNIIISAGIFLRQRIIKAIDKSLPSKKAEIMKGMLLGYKDGIEKEVRDSFSDSGLAHIMAVSGLHVGFIVAALIFLFRKLRFNKTVSNLLIFIILIIYSAAIGFTPSVVRASIMISIILAGQMLKRETDVLTSISFAAILLLLFNPYNIYSVGFQLSFSATISIVLFYNVIKNAKLIKKLPEFISKIASVSIAAQIGVMPVIAYYFNKVSIVTVFANIIAVPIAGITIISGFIMVVIGQFSIVLSQFVGNINSLSLSLILLISKLSSNIPFAVWTVYTPSVIIIFIYYSLVLFFLKIKPAKNIKLKPSYYIIVFALIVILFVSTFFMPQNMEVVFLDVGSGDSAFIRTQEGKTVLIDGGGYNSYSKDEPNTGEMIIIPFLLEEGISKIDVMIGTHGHSDHVTGLNEVLKAYRVEKIVLPDVESREGLEEILNVSRQKEIPVYRVEKGDNIKLDSYTNIAILHPQDEFSSRIDDLNNNSIVANLKYKDISILFTGDIEEEAEQYLIRESIDVKCNVLKVAHHGADTSTTKTFLENAKPSVAIISVGRNKFGHPSNEIIERLKERNVIIYRTDLNGAIMLKSDGKKLKISSQID